MEGSDLASPAPAPAKSDLPTRFAAAVAMIAVALAAVYLGGWVFRLLVVAAAAVMLIEWSDMHRVPRLWGYVGAALLAIALVTLSEYLFPVEDLEPEVTPASFHPVWPAVGALAISGAVLALLARRFAMFAGYLYVGIPAFALIVLAWFDYAWPGIVFWVMIVTWSTDSFAYFAGRSIGGPKLAPRISPSKTWSGLVGGIIGAELMGFLVAGFFGLGSPFLYVGGFMGLVAQGGDLFESWLKRRAGVKDSGTILPGHGGALDRLDGFLPVILVTLAILMLGLWTG
jgi:phosphatidate cytidylyltransferase